MTLNSNSFLDFSHSYLQFKYTNKTNKFCQPDLGVPFFSRLQIMSGGQELEDIQEYSRLYSILQAAQGSDTTTNEQSLTQHNAYKPLAAVSGAGGMANDGAVYGQSVSQSCMHDGHVATVEIL